MKRRPDQADDQLWPSKTGWHRMRCRLMPMTMLLLMLPSCQLINYVALTIFGPPLSVHKSSNIERVWPRGLWPSRPHWENPHHFLTGLTNVLWQPAIRSNRMWQRWEWSCRCHSRCCCCCCCCLCQLLLATIVAVCCCQLLVKVCRPEKSTLTRV